MEVSANYWTLYTARMFQYVQYNVSIKIHWIVLVVKHARTENTTSLI
jgi:hypothetical protein